MTTRTLQRVILSQATSDGGGVKLRRSLGQSRGLYLDPFLMLDEFSSDNPRDYIAGFPAHPHRGFETVTYLLEGYMLHEDHLGNRGDLKSGGVQWMTAGRGIVHSEMPQQLDGRMRGFQLWINLPAREKMTTPGYRDIESADIPQAVLPGGGEVRVIAGAAVVNGQRIVGPVAPRTTDPLYLDLHLPAGATYTQAVTADYSAFVYPYEGTVKIGPAGDAREVAAGTAGILSGGDQIEIMAAASGARVLVLAAKPLREPIVQYGPFVMNTRDEIEQAIRDYQSGRLIAS